MREHSGQACCFLGFGVRGGLRSRPVGVIFESAGLGFAAVVSVFVVGVVAGASGRTGASALGKSWRWIPDAAAAVPVAAVVAVANDIGDDDGSSACCSGSCSSMGSTLVVTVGEENRRSVFSCR